MGVVFFVGFSYLYVNQSVVNIQSVTVCVIPVLFCFAYLISSPDLGFNCMLNDENFVNF